MIRISAAVALSLAALASPAFATEVIHNATNEMGYTVHPDHAKAGKSRAEVLAELDAAKKQSSWSLMRLGAPLPMTGGTPLTREQVEADLLRAQKHPSWSARRVGAPVTMN